MKKILEALKRFWLWSGKLAVKNEWIFSFPLAVFFVLIIVSQSILAIVAFLLWIITILHNTNKSE